MALDRKLKMMTGPVGFGRWLAGLGILLCAVVSVAEEKADFSVYTSAVEENLVLAGELDLEALRAAHDGGVVIVDLRTEKEGAPEEAAAAEALGLTYRNIPVSSAEINPDQVSTLQQALAEASADELVVIHCRTGNRAGLLWGASQLEAGVPLEQVQESVSGIVTMAPINQGLEAYAKTLDAQ